MIIPEDKIAEYSEDPTALRMSVALQNSLIKTASQFGRITLYKALSILLWTLHESLEKEGRIP